MRCTLTHTAAHHAAWKIGILHRDLSPGNIMIFKEGDGLLIDWDLCKVSESPPTDGVARRYARTVSKCLKYHISRVLRYFHQGTWQFMAAELVQDPSIPHTLEHDLESVFWVLLWMTLLYMETSWDIGLRSSVLNSTMNPDVYMGCGGIDKLNFMQAEGAVYKLKTLKSPGMQAVLIGVHGIVRKPLLVQKPLDFPSPETNGSADDERVMNVTKSTSATETTQSGNDITKPEHLHDALINEIDKYLKNNNWWAAEDDSKLQHVAPSAEVESSAWSGTKRSRDTEMGSLYCSEPQAKRSC